MRRVTLTFLPSSFRRYSTVVVTPLASVVSTRGGNSARGRARKGFGQISLRYLAGPHAACKLRASERRPKPLVARSRGRCGPKSAHMPPGALQPHTARHS